MTTAASGSPMTGPIPPVTIDQARVLKSAGFDDGCPPPLKTRIPVRAITSAGAVQRSTKDITTATTVEPTKTSRAVRQAGRSHAARTAVQLPNSGPVESSAPRMGPRCAVYLHYDKDGILLYVGMSVAPSLRIGQHAEGSTWVEFAVRGKIVWFDSEADASAQEAELIRTQLPLFNVAHAAPGAERRLVEYLAERKRYELLLPKVRKG